MTTYQLTPRPCSLCGKETIEYCSSLTCRACHKSITLEDCINKTTADDLAWKAMKRAAGVPEDQL